MPRALLAPDRLPFSAMPAKPPADFAAERLIAQTQQVADRDLLQSMLDRRRELLDAKLIDHLVSIYSRIAPGSDMEKLFDRAARAYGDAALAAAGAVLTRIVIDGVKDGDGLDDLRGDWRAEFDDDDDE